MPDPYEPTSPFAVSLSKGGYFVLQCTNHAQARERAEELSKKHNQTVVTVEAVE